MKYYLYHCLEKTLVMIILKFQEIIQDIAYSTELFIFYYDTTRTKAGNLLIYDHERLDHAFTNM